MEEVRDITIFISITNTIIDIINDVIIDIIINIITLTKSTFIIIIITIHQEIKKAGEIVQTRRLDSFVISASLKQWRRRALLNIKRRNTEFMSAKSVTRKEVDLPPHKIPQTILNCWAEAPILCGCL